MPLVRGPFGSLTAARAAIEDGPRRRGAGLTAGGTPRGGEGPAAPDAGRHEATAGGPPRAGRATGRPRRRPASRSGARPHRPAPVAAVEAARRRRLPRRLPRRSRCGSARCPRPGDAPRAPSSSGSRRWTSRTPRRWPARRSSAASRPSRGWRWSARSPAVVASHADREAAVAAVVALLTAGEDAELGVRWRLVDGEDRAMGEVPDRDGS